MDTQKPLSKNKNFVLLFLGTITTNVGAVLYSFAVSFYILKITENNALIQGIYLAVGGVVCLIFSFFGGVFADRNNCAKILVWCDYARGAFILLSALLIHFFDDNVFQIVLLFALGVISNLISAMFSPASNAIIPQVVEKNLLQKANSYFTMLSGIQSILGIVLAGVLYAALSVEALFAIVGVCYLASGFSETFIKIDFVKPETPLTLKTTFGDVKDALVYLKSLPAIVVMIVACMFVNFFFSPVFSNGLPYFITTDLTGSNYMFSDFLTPEMWNSLIGVAESVAVIVCSAIFSASKPSEKNGRRFKTVLCFLALTLVANAICYLVFVPDSQINAYLISLLAFSLCAGSGVSAINIPTSTMMQSTVDKDKIAKVMSLMSIGSTALLPISSFLAGLLIDVWGLGVMFAVCAGGFLLTSLVVAFNKPLNNI